MTQQAARVGDPHTCPMVTPSPHIGGPILPAGCPTVVIGGQPAARVGDTCQCTGPTDMIRSGVPTVLIGGAPAARLGDQTQHGGIIVKGFPTVLIGPMAPGELFSDAYMRALVGKTLEGADSDELQDAMNTLWEHRHDPNHPDVNAALQKLADARGRPLGEIQSEWGKYQTALAEQERIAAAKGLDPSPGLNWMHPNFMGSTSQLRSGQVVGDALGMDPAFGALLNPSGGLVGPGNTAFDGDDSAVGYHGAVHDAAGYLYNYHDQGPGYDYMGLEGRDTASPLSGQRAGISYWRDIVPDRSGGQEFTDAASDVIMDGVVGGIDGVSNAYDTVKDVVSSGYDTAKDVVSSGYDKAKDVASGAWNWLTK